MVYDNRVFFSEIIVDSLQFCMHQYLKDWYQHRGAAQAELQVGVQEINTIKIQSHPTAKTLDLRCNERIFHLVTSKNNSVC
jgi:hypothetical protein